jgi:hypothetical protein
VLAGDLCESLEDLDFVLRTLGPRFGRLVWVPGNHELWTLPGGACGVAKYEQCVDVCREHGVLTPEDPYEVFRATAVTWWSRCSRSSTTRSARRA